MRQCEPAAASVGSSAAAARAGRPLSIRDRLPQIEVAVGEYMTALVLRILAPPTRPTRPCCATLPTATQWSSTCSRRGRQRPFASIRRGPRLSYLLPDYNIEHFFSPTEFTQVNPRSTACWCGGR
jgi:23S rRNA (uracil1939-C5)-methyltransferase